MPTTYKISTKLLQDIADYLTTKPYKEVVALLSELQKEADNQGEEKTNG